MPSTQSNFITHSLHMGHGVGTIYLLFSSFYNLVDRCFCDKVPAIWWTTWSPGLDPALRDRADSGQRETRSHVSLHRDAMRDSYVGNAYVDEKKEE